MDTQAAKLSNDLSEKAIRLRTWICNNGARVVINFEDQSVTLDEVRVILSKREHPCLMLLAGNPGQIYSRKRIVERVYEGIKIPRSAPDIIDVFICHLREKLGAARLIIETEWGKGYRMRIADEEA